MVGYDFIIDEDLQSYIIEVNTNPCIEESSQLLKATANDVAQLLQKAITDSTIAIEQYKTLPTTGIILIYNATLNGNQTCAVKSNVLVLGLKPQKIMD